MTAGDSSGTGTGTGTARRPRSWQEMREQEIRWLVERTGEGLDTWNERVLASGITDEAGLRTWLTEKGVTGYPAMLLVMEAFGYPDYLQATADELIDGQYADRPELRPVLDTILLCSRLWATWKCRRARRTSR